jgi:ATP-binding cassette, subfamily C, bacterial
MRYPCVLQHSEEDCGAACLATIAKYYGKTFTITRIREAIGTGQHGTTLLGLKRGAEGLGFFAKGGRAAAEILEKTNAAQLPAIIHWKGYHYVVLYGRKGKKYIIADPAFGVRHLTRNELLEGWKSYITLFLEPDPVRFFEQSSDPVTGLQRVIRQVLVYRSLLLQAFAYGLLVGLLALAYPFLIQVITDQVLVQNDLGLLSGVAIAVIIMTLISSGLKFVQYVLVAHFAQRLELGLILEFGRQILRLPLAYYEARRSGEIVSRLRDISQINQLVSQAVVTLPSQFFVALISVGFMLFYSVRLSLIAFLIAVITIISTAIFLPTLQRKVRKALVLATENQGTLVETFKGALTLKTTGAEAQLWDEFQSRFGELANLNFRTVQIAIINSVLSGMIIGVGSVSLLWFGSRLVIQQELSIGQLLAYNSMNANFLALVTLVITFFDEFARAKTATQRLTEIIEATPEEADGHRKPLAEIAGEADVVCSNLTFHHPGRVDLLEDFSLSIPGGKVTALIGQSGCGKSTVSKLISGLYFPASGNIRIGVYNLHDLALESVRKQVILIPQDAHFWSRTIIDNFQLGNPDIAFEQIVKACQIAEADGFISELPDKYQTILGEFGANLSGGQRQRLAIARAIVTDPPILILDESTASLDPVSETQVLDNLLLHRKGKTTILISHRPTVINRADWVVLLEQGRLKLQGEVEELLSTPGDHCYFLKV